MMDMISQRVLVERLLEAARTKPENEARGAIADALVDQRQIGHSEMSLIAAALAALHGKPVKLPTRLLASLPVHGGVLITIQGAELEVRAVTSLDGPGLAHLIAGIADRPTGPAPTADVAPANLEEPEEAAANRIAGSIQTHLSRHYDGEIRHRGTRFLTKACLDILCLALGAELANADPDAVTARVADISQQLPVRVAYYQAHVEQKIEQTEPGEQPSPVDPMNRLH